MRDWGERDARWRGVRSETVDLPVATDRGPVVTTVHLLRAGPAEVDGSPPTLLVHGLGGSATNWLEVMARLADTGPVVAVDLPGFGRTEPPDPRAARLRPQVRFLRRLLDRLGWDRAAVHGSSMGGLLGVLLAVAAPDRVASLTLTCPALPPPRSSLAVSSTAVLRLAPFVSWRLGGLVLERVHARTPAEQIRRGTMAMVLGEADDVRPAVRVVQLENLELARTEAWRAPAFARAAGDVVSTLGLATSVHRAVDAVAVPTTVVWGEMDRLVGRSTIDAVLARRPDWTRIDLDRVGHVPMLEAPDRWLEAVRSAAAPVPGGAGRPDR